MSQKNQFNMYDKSDLPLGSNDFQVEQVRDKSTKIPKSRIRRASKSTDISSTKENTKKTTTLTSTSIDMADLEVLNEQNLHQYRFRSRRNKTIISILAVLLLIALAVIGTFAVITQMQNNCFLYVSGGNAHYLVDGEEMDRFRAPSAITGNTVYVLNVDLAIERGSYNVKFKVDAFMNNDLLDNTLLDYDQNVFRMGDDGYYYSLDEMSGTINLFDRVILDISYKNTLNVNNFKLEVHTYLFN